MAIRRTALYIALLSIVASGFMQSDLVAVAAADSDEVVPNQLVSRDTTDDVPDAIAFHSHEVTEAQITRLYNAYFGRTPDEAGLNYWLRAMVQGNNLEDVSGFFATSEEFGVRYGSVTDDEFVSLLYRNVLGREADMAGLDYWRNTLNKGVTRGQLMAFFSESPEYVTKTGTTPPDFDDRSVAERKSLTYEQRRGYAALDRIGFSAARYLPEWEIRFLPQKPGHFGLTYPREKVIEVYVRPTQSQSFLEHTIAHEIGHAVDLTLLTSSERQAWQVARGIKGKPWWPGDGTDDRSTGAGDFAESFAALQIRTPHFMSRIAGYPSAAEQQLMASLFLK